MKITYVSKHGLTKEESQDCILVNDKVINNHAGILDVPLQRLCIADGVGGVPGGYEASSFVLNNFAEVSGYKTGEDLKKCLVNINEDLIYYAAGLEEKRAMATTVTGLARIENELWVMHAGNTRLYTFGAGLPNKRLKQITKDHTNYQAMVVDGSIEMPKSDTDNSAILAKNVIYCCFGTGNREYLDALQVEKLQMSDVPELFMLTSDGIHDYVDAERIEQILADNLDDRNKILALLDAAAEGGSSDDCTIVIARVK